MLKKIDNYLLEKLQCPNCNRSSLNLYKNNIKCTNCQQKFKINKNIIIFAENSIRNEYYEENLFWEENINKFYEDENERSFKKYLNYCPIKPTDTVIEIGCGSGAMLNHIKSNFKVGIDLSLNLLSYGSSFYALQSVAENLPFKKETFNIVYFKHSLHHILNKEKALKEAERILKRDGYLMLYEPNLSHPHRRLLSNPQSIFRKIHFFTKFIGPIETFMTEKKVLEICGKLHLFHESTHYLESSYNRITLRQFLQKVYRLLLGVLLPERFIYPNYVMVFKKPVRCSMKKLVGKGC